MATYFVAKTGDDANAGTSVSAPKLTIDSAWLAVALLDSDDEIIILDSETYTGSDNYQLSNRNVTTFTIKGDDGTYSGSRQLPVIDGGNTAEWFMYVRGTAGDGWTIENLKFINFLVDGGGVGILRFGSGLDQRLVVNDCIFDGNVGRCLGLDDNTTLSVNRCQFINHQDPDPGNQGIIMFSGTNTKVVTIVNCLFANIGTKDNDFRLVSTLDNANSKIEHCTIAKRNTDVASADVPLYLFDIGPGTFQYNIVYNFDAKPSSNGATVNGTAAATVQYNTYGSTDPTWSGSAGPLRGGGTETGNLIIESDPGFFNYDDNIYTLTAAARSIALDVSSGSTQTVDITNANRSELDKLAYNAGLNDNGCYEASFWTPTTEITTCNADGDYTIRTYLNANAGHNRLKVESGEINRTLDQIPFSVGLNGIIPTSIRQRGTNVAVTEDLKPSHVFSKGKTSNNT